MSAHTPGPWKVHDLYPRVVVTEKNDEENLLHIDYTMGGDGVAAAPTAADAKLIAAAPDLLAALKQVLALSPERAIAAVCNAAIAKAERSP